MALPEIKESIEHEARSGAAKISRETEKEVERVLEEARKAAAERISKAREEAKEGARLLLGEKEAEAEVEAARIVNSAMEEAVEKEMSTAKKEAMKEIAEKYMPAIIKRALARFNEISESGEVFAEVNKRYAALVKGLKNVNYANIDGAVLFSGDRKIRLALSPEGVVESNAGRIRSAISKALFK